MYRGQDHEEPVVQGGFGAGGAAWEGRQALPRGDPGPPRHGWQRGGGEGRAAEGPFRHGGRGGGAPPGVGLRRLPPPER